MTYKFRSLKEPGLRIVVHDADGDEVAVQFENFNGIGLFHTDDDNLAKGMLADKRNGVVFMDADYPNRKGYDPLKGEEPPKPKAESVKKVSKPIKKAPSKKRASSKKSIKK